MRRVAAFALCLSVGLGTAEASAPSGSASAPPAPRVGPAPVSWEGAAPLPLARPSELCEAVRLGEWARVTCRPNGFIMDVYLMGGSHEGVSFREAKAEKRPAPADAGADAGAGTAAVGPGVHIVFPVREGDRREFAISYMLRGGYTIEEDVAVVISELWLPGESGPVIVAAGNPL